MKRVMAMVLTLSLILTMAAVMPVSAALADWTGENLLTNSTFADGVTGWGSEGETVIVHDKSVAEGEAADKYVQLTPKWDEANQKYVGGAGQLTQDYTGFKAGEVYMVEVTYKATTDDSAWALIINSKWQAQASHYLPKTGDDLETAEWGTYRFLYRVSDSLDVLRVYLRVYPYHDPRDGCYFDEVKLTKINGVDTNNLIMNPGFEWDDDGATSIIGWENTGADKLYKAWYTENDTLYCPPTEENGKNVAYANTTAGNAVLKQTITVDDEAPYYQD